MRSRAITRCRRCSTSPPGAARRACRPTRASRRSSSRRRRAAEVGVPMIAAAQGARSSRASASVRSDSGRVPRRAYAALLHRGRGAPQPDPPSELLVDVLAAVRRAGASRASRSATTRGRELGTVEREVPRFGSAFIEMRELLAELGASDGRGDRGGRPRAVGRREERARATSRDRSRPRSTRRTGWRTTTRRELHVRALDRQARRRRLRHHKADRVDAQPRSGDEGERWRSWRLLELDRLSEIQVVAINHSPRPGRTMVGVYASDGRRARRPSERSSSRRASCRARPRARRRARRGRAPPGPSARIGLDPLLTGKRQAVRAPPLRIRPAQHSPRLAAGDP